MNIRIQRACEPDSLRNELGSGSTGSMPAGFPFAVSSNGEIIEPILGFLSEHFLSRTTGRLTGSSVASAVSAAYELADYWRYLARSNKRWDEVEVSDIELYRDSMYGSISPKTQVELSQATITHRTSTVVSFYGWANANHEHVALMTSAMTPLRGRQRATSYTSKPSGDARQRGTIARPRASYSDEAVHVLTIEDYRRVANELGPLPSDEQRDERASRDRLIAELALQTGLRRFEVAHLTTNQILGLAPDASAPYAVVPLRIIVTKGGRPRTVLLPSWLAIDLMSYIDNERALAIPTRRRPHSKLRTENALFVAHPWARQHVGHALSPAHLDHLYRKAVLNAALTRDVIKTDPFTGKQHIDKAPAHVFHGLRHTFAVWTYYARREAGDVEPWKYIQAALGHRSLDTTLNLYLRAASTFEATVSDRLMRQMQIMRQHTNYAA